MAMQLRFSRDAMSSHRFRYNRCPHTLITIDLLSMLMLTQVSFMHFQIVKILNSYTPIDDFEKRVAPSFVRKVQASLWPLLNHYMKTFSSNCSWFSIIFNPVKSDYEISIISTDCQCNRGPWLFDPFFVGIVLCNRHCYRIVRARLN